MKKINIIRAQNYFEVFLLLGLGLLFLYLIRSFILPILFASALVFLSYKPFQKLDAKIKNRTLSALFVMLIVLILLLYPTYWLFGALVNQTSELIETTQEISDNFDLPWCEFEFCRTLEENVDKIGLLPQFIIDATLGSVAGTFELINKTFGALVEFFLSFFVFLLAFFYLLRDGEDFTRYLKRLIPMKSEYKNALFIKFRDVNEAVFINTLFVAALQGSLVGLIFWILGFQSPVFWGVVASFAALLPVFGPALVWFPAGIYLLLINEFVAAIVLLVYGFIFVSFIDNFARAYLLKHSIKVHEFLILISIFGGIKVFGFFMGIFIGPMIISFLVAVLNLYGLDFTHEEKPKLEPNIFK